MKTPSKNDCPLNEPKCCAIDCNCKIVPQSVEVMTLEECKYKIGYEIGFDHIERNDRAAELYASQFKAKAEHWQHEHMMLSREYESDKKHYAVVEKTNADYVKIIDRFLESDTNELLAKYDQLQAELSEYKSGLKQCQADRDELHKELEQVKAYLRKMTCIVEDLDRHLIWEEEVETANKALQSTKQ